jgi:hypothetical protein
MIQAASSSRASMPPDKLRAIALLGKDRVQVHPDCSFATFVDNPISSVSIAEVKLTAIARAVETRGTE